MAREYVGDMEFGRCPYAGAATELEEHGDLHAKVAGAWAGTQRIWANLAGVWRLSRLYVRLGAAWRRIL